MKKVLACLLTLMLLCSASALAEGRLAGGWSATESAEVTSEMQTLLEAALNGLTGAVYTPVALLGTQIVAGTNYCFLCRASAVILDPQPYYALVYVYQDLDGNAALLSIQELTLGV